MRKATALIFIGLSATACTVTAPPPGGGGGIVTPPPPPRADLPTGLSTADGDVVAVSGQAGSGAGPVRLCLSTSGGMWKKEIRISGGGILRSENGTTDCTTVDAGFVRFGMAKAKALGVITGVGNGSMDLTGWGGGNVTIAWQRD